MQSSDPPVTDPEPHLSSDQIDAMLNAGVAATVAYAREHSPYYRGTLVDAKVVHGVADLATLPLTTKRDVSQFNADFWCVDQKRVLDIATTSGTTGVPTLYPLTRGDLDRLGRNEFLCFSRVGLRPSDVVILAVTIDKCFMAGLAYLQGLRALGVTVVRVGAGSPAMLLSMMQRLGATAVVSVPSFLKRVAAYAEQHGIDVAGSTVTKLVCIGEPVRDPDGSLTPLGAHVATVWGAQVYSTYGITELASSMCECSAGRGGHLHPSLLHIEVLNDAGRPVADGLVGQLVATTIGVEAMPLIRFATGDMTFMTRQRCACGLWTPRIGPILGRKDHAMKLKGTTVYPAAVQRALAGIESVVDYVMIATSSSDLSDELEVVVSWRGDTSNAIDIICERLRGNLKVCPTVRLASATEVAQLGDSKEQRKQRVFVDKRQDRR